MHKLYGGPDGFSICAGVVQPDADHAATLLACAAHILRVLEPLRFPGGQRPDLVLALASGPASSGLLGFSSLTYQIVGRAPSVARELTHTQLCLPFV